MRLPRWARRSLAALLALVLLVAAILVAAFHSETAFRFALDSARPFIPGEIGYAGVRGTLAGPVHVDGLDYRVAGTHIEARMLAFDLSPWSLFRARIRIDRLDAEGLTVTLADGDARTDDAPARPRDILSALALPVHIQAHDINATDARVLGADGRTIVELDHLRAALDWNDQRAALTALDASGPQFDVKGDLVLALQAPNATRLSLRGHWKGASFPLRATMRGDGDANDMALAVELEEPARASLDARLHDLLDAPSWQGTLHVAALEPAAFAATLPATTLRGEFRFAGDWSDTRIEGRASGDWPPANGIDATIDAVVNEKRVRVDALHGRVAAFDATFDAKGDIDYADALAYRAEGTIARFTWPGLEPFALRDARFDGRGDATRLDLSLTARAGANAAGRIAFDGGIAFADLRANADINASDLRFAFDGTTLEAATVSATVSGTPDDYTATLATHLGVNELPAADLTLRARGNRARIDTTIDALEWLDGTANGRVLIAWRDGIEIDADVHGKAFALAHIDPRVDGRIGGRVSMHAALAGDQPDISVDLQALSGEIAGTALQGSGALRLAGGRLTTRGVNIRAGDARLELEDSAKGFDFHIDVPAFSDVHAALDGRVTAQGHFEGSLDAPTVQLSLDAHDLAWRDMRAAALRIDADIHDGGIAASTLRIDAGALESSWVKANALALELRGDRAAHRVALNIEGGGNDGAGALEFAANGAWRDSQWRGRIDALHVMHPATGAWQLDAPSREEIVIGGNIASAPEHCLQGPSGRACIGPVHRSPDAFRMNANLQQLPVGIVAGLLPAGLDYGGAVSGEMHIASTPAGFDGSGEFRLGAGAVRQAGDDAETLLGWESGHARVNFDGKLARGELAIELLQGDRITGSGTLERITNGKDSDTRIDARLDASIGNLGIIPALVPELSDLRGHVDAGLRVDGPLREPRIRGEASLRDGSARVLALGTEWREMEFTLHAEGREISLEGHAASGDGHIDVRLEARDAGTRLTGKAALTGENFKAISTPEADVDISPNLNLALDGNDLFIDGSVFVPYARITPRDLSTAAQASPDQVIVNAEDAANDDLRVHAAVTTQLGDDVRVDAFGLAARLEGRLTVAKLPGNPATGNGRLIVAEGQYEAYGQDLTLAKGELIYTGQPLSNPGLDVRAERKPQADIMVGVAVRGPLSQPATSVYSDPAMPQTQALAYLLFGRSIEQATGEEEGQISEAAIALGLGGQKLLGNVGRKLGVEEFRVEEVSDRERAALVLGKYLSPDLYVSYGIGLFDAVNTARIRYRISSKWTLEATSGLKSSADFIYTIER